MSTIPKLFKILSISVMSVALTQPLFAGALATPTPTPTPTMYGCCVACINGSVNNFLPSEGSFYGPNDEQLCANDAFHFCRYSEISEFKFGPGLQTCAPASTPSSTPTPTATPTPTPTPIPCTGLWPVVGIMTLGKGQSPSNNQKVVNFITGNIIDPDSLGDTAHRIPVCSGTRVDVTVTDTTGTPTLAANSSGISCTGSACVVMTIGAKEKYIARSRDGKDTDRMTLLPQ
jgi:hypothetical protein